MCVSPILIKNPNWHNKTDIAKYKDTVSQYIRVPCGKCPECLHKKQMQIVQRVQMESYNSYMFFATLTYNNESLPHLITSTGYDIRYADFRDFTNMVKRLRNDNLLSRPFRYFAVSELGTKRGRPHFHALFYLPKYETDTLYTPFNLEKHLFKTILSEWRRNYGSKRNPNYKPLCTYTTKAITGKIFTNYDLHYITPSALDGSTHDVGFYITKYMLKSSERVNALQQALKLNLPPDEYKDTWNLVKPRWQSSKLFGFGLFGIQNRNFDKSLLKESSTFQYIQSGIRRSYDNDFPLYYNPDTGRPFPLSRYWYNINDLFTLEDYKHFKQLQDTLDGNVVEFTRTPQEYKQVMDKYKKQSSIIDDKDINFDLF